MRARARAPAVGGRGQPPTAHTRARVGARVILPAVPEPLSIAQVTPYLWEDRHDVNTFVARVSDELAARGHRVLVVAPSTSRTLVRDSRKAVREAARSRPRRARCACSPSARRCRRYRAGAARRSRSTSRARSPTSSRCAALDVCHVHEPFAPSVASTALRHSRALNVGTFHAPTERVVATQVARKVVQLVFGRLDARTATYGATAELLRRFFPGDYAIVAPGADPLERRERRRRGPGAHRLRRAGGARGPAAVPALAAPPRPGAAVGGGRALRARPLVLDAAARRPARARALRRRRRDGAGPAPTSWWPPPTASPRRPG